MSRTAKRDALRRKLRNNPTNATMQDVETLLARFGFTLACVSGSHHIFEYVDKTQTRQITVPFHGRKVKKVYVEQISAMLDELFPIEIEHQTEVEADDEEQNN